MARGGRSMSLDRFRSADALARSAAVLGMVALFVLLASAAVAQTSLARPVTQPVVEQERLPFHNFSPMDGEFARSQGSIIPGHYIVALKESVAHPVVLAEIQTEQRDGELQLVYRHALKGYAVA